MLPLCHFDTWQYSKDFGNTAEVKKKSKIYVYFRDKAEGFVNTAEIKKKKKIYAYFRDKAEDLEQFEKDHVMIGSYKNMLGRE